MSKRTRSVPVDVWETAFACFAGHVGVQMGMYRKGEPMPEVWANVFRYACDDAALERLGIPPVKADDPSPSKAAA